MSLNLKIVIFIDSVTVLCTPGPRPRSCLCLKSDFNSPYLYIVIPFLALFWNAGSNFQFCPGSLKTSLCIKIKIPDIPDKKKSFQSNDFRAVNCFKVQKVWLWSVRALWLWSDVVIWEFYIHSHRSVRLSREVCQGSGLRSGTSTAVRGLGYCQEVCQGSGLLSGTSTGVRGLGCCQEVCQGPGLLLGSLSGSRLQSESLSGVWQVAGTAKSDSCPVGIGVWSVKYRLRNKSVKSQWVWVNVPKLVVVVVVVHGYENSYMLLGKIPNSMFALISDDKKELRQVKKYSKCLVS